MTEHGMILVNDGRLTVPTCLCGWIGAGQKGAMAFSLARKTWRTHVELEGRLTKVNVTINTTVREETP